MTPELTPTPTPHTVRVIFSHPPRSSCPALGLISPYQPLHMTPQPHAVSQNPQDPVSSPASAPWAEGSLYLQCPPYAHPTLAKSCPSLKAQLAGPSRGSLPAPSSSSELLKALLFSLLLVLLHLVYVICELLPRRAQDLSNFIFPPPV